MLNLKSETSVYKTFPYAEKGIIRSKKGRSQYNIPRKIAMYIAQKCGDYRLKGIADAFGLAHYGGASSAIHHASETIKIDTQLMNRINSIINRFDP